MLLDNPQNGHPLPTMHFGTVKQLGNARTRFMQRFRILHGGLRRGGEFPLLS